MRNVSQSQSHLPPVLKPRSGESRSGRRSVELPPVHQVQTLSEQTLPNQTLPKPNIAAQPPEGSQVPQEANLSGSTQGRSKPKPNARGGLFQPAHPKSIKSKPLKAKFKQAKFKPSFKPQLNFKISLNPELLQAVQSQLKRFPKLAVPSMQLPSLPLPSLPPLPPLPAFLKTKQKPWEWSIVWLWALGGFGGLGIVAFAWMASLPPLPECRTVTRLSPGNQRLYCAQEQAQSGQLQDLLAAMALLNGWSEQEPLYTEVQRSISEWSTLVLITARDRMMQNDLKGAIDTANQIPASSAVYPEAQKTIDYWQEQWQHGEQIYAAAQGAIQAQNWSEAAHQMSMLNELQQDYWRVTQADRLAQQIQAEKQGWQALTKARKVAKDRSLSSLVAAIELTKNIPPETYVWQATQADLKQWGQALLGLAMRQWQQGELEGAVAAAQQVPLNVPLPPEVQDLVRFSHANQQVTQAGSRTGLNSPWQDVWNLMEGISAMAQISPTSPLYVQAQAKQKIWEKQFQDELQLQWATLGAELGQRSTLGWAIEQSQPLVGQSPVADRAQNLIADWQRQIQILEDQPILQTAVAIAAQNTVPDLQQAIVYLRQIPSDRGSWSEAQRLTAEWQQQIQVLEDQPIWDEAQKLAKRKQYSKAIAVAQRISANRALYPQTQQAIEAWEMAIRSVEMVADRKILERAKALAAKGDLTEAIATAAEIQPGRDLYLDAQGAIGQWLKQRDGDASGDPNDSGTPEELF